MENQFEAVLWDFDGVIVDSEKLWLQRAPGFYQKQVGQEICPDVQTRFVGGSLHNAWTILAEEYGLSSTFEQFETECIEFATVEMYPFCNLLPHVEDCFCALENAGIPQAIASSGHIEWVGPSAERLGIEKYFETVVTSGDVGGIGKPEPDVFLLAAKQLGADPSKCLVIEDSTNGCVAGKAAGAMVWGFRNGWNEKQDLSLADWEFDSFVEAVKNLQKR